jgi:two-component system, LuxR family, response regulator FixJ
MKENPRAHQLRLHPYSRALVATEDLQLRNFLADGLSRADYGMDWCGGARQEVLERCGTKSHSFVIVDVVAESRIGMEVVGELRARGAMLPVILLSGGAGAPEGAAGVEHLSKPFTLETLKLAIERALTRLSLEEMAPGDPDGPPPRSE